MWCCGFPLNGCAPSTLSAFVSKKGSAMLSRISYAPICEPQQLFRKAKSISPSFTISGD
jgi:hypothetical protein